MTDNPRWFDLVLHMVAQVENKRVGISDFLISHIIKKWVQAK